MSSQLKEVSWKLQGFISQLYLRLLLIGTVMCSVYFYV